MVAAQRIGVDEQVKRARALFNRGLRRDLQDHATLKALIAAIVPREGHTIDVGAHAGDFVAELVRVAPDGRHVAFEPIPELASSLRDRFPQVDVHEAALSDEAGETTFEHVTNMPGYSGLRRRSLPADAHVHQLTVRLERLDDVLPEEFRPSFIKIDVEGAELQVMRGARETIRTHRPYVVFEHGIGGSDVYGTTPGMVHDFLVGECEMRIFDLAGDGPYSPLDFEAVFDQPIWNFIACP
jgi:FkbM family methyltransferase